MAWGHGLTGKGIMSGDGHRRTRSTTSWQLRTTTDVVENFSKTQNRALGFSSSLTQRPVLNQWFT